MKNATEKSELEFFLRSIFMKYHSPRPCDGNHIASEKDALAVCMMQDYSNRLEQGLQYEYH